MAKIILKINVHGSVYTTSTQHSTCSSTHRLAAIVESTGAATYHGFLPALVRDCVMAFTSPVPSAEFPLTFSTALFSFLYHLATYESSEYMSSLYCCIVHV